MLGSFVDYLSKIVSVYFAVMPSEELPSVNRRGCWNIELCAVVLFRLSDTYCKKVSKKWPHSSVG